MPDWSPGDVIAAYSDGTIVLDDGLTTWNPERANDFLQKTNGAATRCNGPEQPGDHSAP
jgi:hypothetical protein